MLAWQPILQQGANVLLSKVLSAAFDAASKKFQLRKPYINLRFRNHFDYAYERCTKIKTIVNGDRPIDLLTNYESPDFSLASNVAKRIDEYGFIELIWENRKTILIGSAGAGKSMFMRYFWVACSVNPRSKIPVFIELRKFNDIKALDFGLFVYATASQGSTGDVRSAFQEAVDEGQFVFVLDGFDELRSDRRSNVEEWILNIGNSQNVILVSGRPDLTFEAWQSFSIYKILPMTLKQTISLVEKIDFDNSVKNKFIQELKRNLFNKHKSFASRPLLATMMLLTFNSYADMPEKIHVFYDQAFDTLFSRHDATKEAFKRERDTKYPIDVFKRYLSYFSLITYNENRTEFSESEVLERVARVGEIEHVIIESNSFLNDLLNCVCILQRDGLNIVYSHRSFQEYFTAYCLVRLSEARACELIQRFAWRSADTVLSMVFDMNRDFVVRSYLFPALTNYIERTKDLTEESTLADHIGALGCGFMIKYVSYTGNSNTILFYLYPFDHPLVAARLVSFALYRPDFTGDVRRNRYISSPTYHPRKDYTSFRKMVLPTVKRIKGGKFFSLFAWKADGTIEFQDQSIDTIHNLPDTALEACKEWLRCAELRQTFWSEHVALVSLHKTMRLDQAKRVKSLDDILNIGEGHVS